MVCVGRKAQVLARRGMDIRRGNHPWRRRAFSAVLTRVAYTSPSPGRRSVWTSSSQLRSPGQALHLVQAVLNAPVVAEPLKQFLWSAPPGAQAGQQILELPAHLPGGYIHFLLLHHCPLPRPRVSQLLPDIISQFGIGPNPPPFNHPRFFLRSPPQAPPVPPRQIRRSAPPAPSAGSP